MRINEDLSMNDLEKDKSVVAFVYYNGLSSFIKTDRDTLSNHFRIRETRYENISDILNIAFTIAKSDVSFSWFAGGHAFLAVMFSKIFKVKSIIIVGGYDVAYLPEIVYGQFASGHFRKFMTRYALKNADKVLVVDPSLKQDAINNAGISGDNFEYLPTGYDSAKFKPAGIKEPLAITVSLGDSWQRVLVKGLDVFVRAAYHLPDIQFLIIGVRGDALENLRHMAAPNVDFIDRLPQEMLIKYYQRAKVYCQISMREGFPNALCEAMLCECIPVGTKSGGIPTAIGKTGYYVPYGDPQSTADAIAKAIYTTENRGMQARQRIIDNFPPERREKELLRIIKQLIHSDKFQDKLL
jgi:glycosyltransferase involved in cell wall biosynthesis